MSKSLNKDQTPKGIEAIIRDLLDNNGFASQKVPSPMPNEQPELFRIRVMQPLRFGVEIIKPANMRDFLLIGGRLNVSPEHQAAIEKIDSEKREKFFDDLRLNLAMQPPTFKLDIQPTKLIAIDLMYPIIISETTLAKDLFFGFDIINKMFFYAMFIMQKHLREGGVDIPTSPVTAGAPPFYT